MLGTAKNAIVVWIGIVFLGETVTVLQGVGYAISLGGFAAYNYLKMQPDPAGANPDQNTYANLSSDAQLQPLRTFAYGHHDPDLRCLLSLAVASLIFTG